MYIIGSYIRCNYKRFFILHKYNFIDRQIIDESIILLYNYFAQMDWLPRRTSVNVHNNFSIDRIFFDSDIRSENKTLTRWLGGFLWYRPTNFFVLSKHLSQDRRETVSNGHQKKNGLCYWEGKATTTPTSRKPLLYI